MQRLLQIIRSQIRYKIILPYLLLVVLVMLVGAGIAIYLVASSYQERFNNQLGQIGRNFADALAQREQANTDFLWQIAFAQVNPEENAPAVAEAIEEGDRDGLARALDPFFRAAALRENSFGVILDRLIAFDLEGKSLIHWERVIENSDAPPSRREYVGTDLSQLDLVQKVLEGEADQVGDKYAALMTFRDVQTRENNLFADDEYYFFTVVPVRNVETDELVGGLLIASRLENLLSALEKQSLSEITAIYDNSGIVLDSTVPPAEGLHELNMPEDLPRQLIQELTTAETYQECFYDERQPLDALRLRNSRPACSILDEVTVNAREYQFLYGPLIIRGTQVGYFSIGLSRDYVTAPWADSRNAVIAVTLILAIGAIIVGYRVAQQITYPLRDLVETAEAVTHGDLDRRSRVTERNEFGTLANAFNQMTEHILRLYTTSCDLNGALEVRQVLDVASRAADAFIPGTEAVALLENSNGWSYHVSTEAVDAVSQLQDIHLHRDEPLLRLVERQRDIQILHAEEAPVLRSASLSNVAGFNTVLLAPLLMQDRLVGLFILGHAGVRAFSDADEQVLSVIANMSVTVLQNSVLYMRVQKDATERQAILTSIGDGVIVCDNHGTIMLVNRIAEEMLGLSEWRTARYNVDMLPLERVPVTREIFGKASEHEHYRVGERVVSRSHAPVIDEDGREIGTVIVLHDITAEAAVDKAKTDFIATISHELRTPLTVIRGFVDLLLRGTGGELTPDQTELMESVRARATEMTSLVNNVITIANIEAGILTTELQPQDPFIVLEMALAPLRPTFEAKGLTLHVEEASADVPQVLADREQLKLVLTQLLDNACRYTQKGSVTIRVQPNGNMVQIDIEDTGPGIAPEMQGMLFTRFQRVEGNNSTERGSGLGLAITKQLIERQGGRVWVTSVPGQGSVFSLVLPQANEQSVFLSQQEAAATS